MLDVKSKIFKVKCAVMKCYLHVLVVLIINAKIVDANFHYTECDMTKVYQSVIWILTIRKICNQTRVWIQDICKFVLFFVVLCPKSTAKVMAGRSVHLTTLFPGQA